MRPTRCGSSAIASLHWSTSHPRCGAVLTRWTETPPSPARTALENITRVFVVDPDGTPHAINPQTLGAHNTLPAETSSEVKVQPHDDIHEATPKTLFEKVWEQHLVAEPEGEPTLLYIDLHLVHEVTSPQAFEGLRLAGRTRATPTRPSYCHGRSQCADHERSRPADHC